MTQQAAFDTSWMNLGPKTLLNQTHQFRCPRVRFFLARRDDESQDLVGQLVRPFRAAFAGNQAGEPTLLEGGPYLIE